MAQDDLVVVGIDVAKDKVDACIRWLSLRQVFPSTAPGHRKLVAWLRKHKVGKAAIEASGGYERDWAKALLAAGGGIHRPSAAVLKHTCVTTMPRTGHGLTMAASATNRSSRDDLERAAIQTRAMQLLADINPSCSAR